MCTLIVFFRAYNGAPLIVAANRDERLDRPARPPFAWEGEDFVAPRDEVALGTWMGVNRSGVFVGITNRHQAFVDAQRPSRGRLVVEALRQRSARDAFERMRQYDGGEENGFHLVMADSEAAYLVWGDGERTHEAELGPGVHVVTERSFDAAPTEREPRIRARVEAMTEAPEDEALVRLLTLQEDGGGFDDVTVHVPDFNYGTRSASIVRLGAEPVFRHAAGPPTTTGFEDFSQLLRQA
ncbi:MAG: NRDE family protein [Deltaproteobacteria bacterium]